MLVKHLKIILFLLIPFINITCTKTETESTGNIEGKIIDKKSGQPVAAAQVQLNSSNQTKFSGTDGYYKFINLAPGNYQISVSKENFQNEVKSISVMRGQTANLDFAIVPANLTITPANQNVSNSSGIIQFIITSNTSWIAAVDKTWCTIDNTSGNGNSTISLTYLENTTPFQRIATLTLSGNQIAPVTATITQQSGIPTTGLVAYYPFNGNANDESGNGNNGAVIGATLTTDRKGIPNKAYYFNGLNNCIKVAWKTSFQNNNFSVACWVNRFSPSNPDGEAYFTIPAVTPTEDAVYLAFRLGLLASYIFSNPNPTITYPYSSDQLIFICYVKENTSLKLYINGIFAKQVTVNQDINYSNARSVLIGADDDSGNDGNGDFHWFYGVLDDLRVYNRVLTESEIQTLYNE